MTEAHDLPSSHSALVPVSTQANEAHRHSVQRPTAFLAQLIASARRLPQARDRRRAAPAEVIAAYQATIQRIRDLNAAESK
jgi:hypothetical protein